METYVVKRLAPVSIANAAAVCLGCIALIMGGLVVVIGTLDRMFGSGPPAFGMRGTEFLIVLTFPIAYALMGWVFGALGAFAYNVLVPYIGGITADLELAPGRQDQEGS